MQVGTGDPEHGIGTREFVDRRHTVINQFDERFSDTDN